MREDGITEILSLVAVGLGWNISSACCIKRYKGP